jgi:IS30 family transposase
MSHYSHLTEEERHQISALLRNETPIAQIARTINRHSSSVYREIQRNKGKRGYQPKQANNKAIVRKASNQAKLTDFCWAYVTHLLEKYWSAEQIVGRLRQLGWDDVPSPESIYQYIYRDKHKGGRLFTFLRCQKKHRKRYGKSQNRRGQIPDRKDISERPAIIEQRIRLGDFEGDTVVGKGHKGVLLTFVDRTTRLTKMRSLPNRKADLISQHSIDLLKNIEIKSITFDNGKEFSHHHRIEDALQTSIYFARPYHSWERGTNENTNGLIRQFFGKEMRLDNLDPTDVQWVEDLLNNRPRKVLGYLTPFEVMASTTVFALHT